MRFPLGIGTALIAITSEFFTRINPHLFAAHPPPPCLLALMLIVVSDSFSGHFNVNV